MLVSHQFAVKPEVYPHAEILPPTKKLLSSQLAHLQPLLMGETHMTERATVSYDCEASVSFSENSWPWPQDGSNIGDVLQALWWMSEMKWERPIYGGTTDFMSTFRFAGTACLACLNGTPLFKCYCLLLLCCASYMLEYCNRSFIYNCTMNTLVCWGCKQRVGHFLITKQISPCSHWQKKAREKSTHSTILAINQPIGFNI